MRVHARARVCECASFVRVLDARTDGASERGSGQGSERPRDGASSYGKVRPACDSMNAGPAAPIGELRLPHFDRERGVCVARQEAHMARDDPRPPHAERFAHLRKGTRPSAPESCHVHGRGRTRPCRICTGTGCQEPAEVGTCLIGQLSSAGESPAFGSIERESRTYLNIASRPW